ncbi:hypothetical protein VIGAN_02120400, partial [Vigna angularis var. angularis]
KFEIETMDRDTCPAHLLSLTLKMKGGFPVRVRVRGKHDICFTIRANHLRYASDTKITYPANSLNSIVPNPWKRTQLAFDFFALNPV